MLTLRSILCPVDFSEPSRHALRCAAALAGIARSRLTVLNAVEPLLAQAAELQLGLDLVRTEIEPALREFVAATLSERTTRTLDLNVYARVGLATDLILAIAASEGADVVVMGTQGLGGVRKWLLGSTTEHVLRRTRTPVLGIPATASDPATVLLAPDGNPVLAATDLSDASTDALEWARDLAHTIGSPLLAVHVVEPVAVTQRWQPYLEKAHQDRVADARARLQRQLEPFAGSVKSEGVVEIGHAADTIAFMADQRRPRAIVMGLGGSEGRPHGARPGSIAYRVLSLAQVPVAVVPQRRSPPLSASELK